MASIILNTLFYPDILNIILDYVMVSKNIVRRTKDVNIYHLNMLTDRFMLLYSGKPINFLLQSASRYRKWLKEIKI
jgi:hypothetical protein